MIAATARDGKPVLGVCLGAQQLAMALGGEVTTGPVAEIGLGRVELTGPGRLDPVTGPEYRGLSAGTITGSGTAASPYSPSDATTTGTTATGASSRSGGLFSSLTSQLGGGGLVTWLVVGGVVAGGWWYLRRRRQNG